MSCCSDPESREKMLLVLYGGSLDIKNKKREVRENGKKV